MIEEIIENNDVQIIENNRFLKYENVKPSRTIFYSNEFRHDVDQILENIAWNSDADVLYKTISTAVQNLMMKNLNLDLQYSRQNIEGLTPDYYDGKMLIEFKVYPFEIPNSLRKQFIEQALEPYENIDCIKRATLIDTSDKSGKSFTYNEWVLIRLLLESFCEVHPIDNVEKIFESTAKRIFELPDDAKDMVDNFSINIGEFHKDRFEILPKIMDSIVPHVSDVVTLSEKLQEEISIRNENSGIKAKLLSKFPLNVICDDFLPIRETEIKLEKREGSSELGLKCFKIFNELFANDIFSRIDKLRKLIAIYTAAKDTKTIPKGYPNLKKLEEVIDREKLDITKSVRFQIQISNTGDITYMFEDKDLKTIGVERKKLLKTKLRYVDKEKLEEVIEMLDKSEKKIKETKEIGIKDFGNDIEKFFDDSIFEPIFEYKVGGTTLFNNEFTNYYGLKVHYDSIEEQERIIHNKYIRVLRAHREFNDLITANTSLDFKNRTIDSMTVCNFFYNKDMRIGGVIFPADNSYTGAIFLFGRYTEIRESDQHNKLDTFITTKGKYFITKSFSLHRAQLKDNLRNFGSALNTFTAWDHFKMKPDGTIMSLFFDPEKELTNLFDLTFYLAKMSGFSFGQILIEDKLEDIKFYKKSVSNFFYKFMLDFETLANNTGTIYLRELIQPIPLKGFNFSLQNQFQHSLITWIKNNMPKDILISNRALITYQWKANIKYKDDYKSFKDSWFYQDVRNFYVRDSIDVKNFPSQIITNGVYNQGTSYLPGATHALNVYTSLRHIQQIDYYRLSRIENIAYNNDGKIGMINWKNSIAIKNSIDNSNTNSINVLKEQNLEMFSKKGTLENQFSITNMVKNRVLDEKVFTESELLRLQKKTEDDDRVKELLDVIEEEIEEVKEEFYDDEDLDIEDIGRVKLKRQQTFKRQQYKPPNYLGFESQKNKNVEFARQMNIIQGKSMKLEGNAFVLVSEAAYFFDLHLIPQMLLVEQDMNTYFRNSGATFSEKVQTSGEKKRIFSVMFPQNRALHQIADDLCGQKLKMNKHSNITIGGHRKLIDFQTLIRFGYLSMGVVEDARRHGERIWQEHVTEKQISDMLLGKMTVGQMNCVIASSLSMWNRKMIIPHPIINGLIRDRKMTTETVYSHTEQGKMLFEKVRETELLINNYKFEETDKFFNDQGKVGTGVFTLNPSFSSFIGYPLGVMSKNVTDTHALIGQLLECDSLLGFGERVTASKHHSDDSFDKTETKYPTSTEFRNCSTGGKWEISFKSFLTELSEVINKNLEKILALQDANAVLAAAEIKKFEFAVFDRQNDKIRFPLGNTYPSVFFSIYCILARVTYSRMICITPSLFKYMITRVIVEKIQVMLMNIKTSTGKNVVDVYSPLNKFLDSVGASNNVLSLNMAVTQKMGMLMEMSLHDCPEKLFFQLQYNVNYLSGYEFRIRETFVDRPIQLFGYYFTTIPLLHQFGLTSDLLRKASTVFGLSLYSKLLNIKTEVKSRINPNQDEFTQLSIMDDKYGASMVLRDFIISCSSGKNIQRAQAKLLKYVDKETLNEAIDMIEERMGSKVLYMRDNAAIALLNQCQSAKSLDNFKMSLRKIMTRKLGYKNSSVNVNGKSWILTELVDDLCKDLVITQSNDFKIFTRFYENEINYFSMLEIKYVKTVEKPLFLGQYAVISRLNPFRYKWDEIMPAIVAAIELGDKVYRLEFEFLIKDLTQLHVWAQHPEISTNRYKTIWNSTISLLKSLNYRLDEMEHKKKLIKDCEFIKKIVSSYTTPAICKQSLLTEGNPLNRSIDFYTIDSGMVLIMNLAQTRKTFIIEKTKIDLDNVLNTIKYEDIIMLMIHNLYNPEIDVYQKDTQSLECKDLKDIAARVLKYTLGESKIKINRMFGIVEHLLMDDLIGQFKFGIIQLSKMVYNQKDNTYIEVQDNIKTVALKIGSLYVGIGCGYIGRDSKKNLVLVNDSDVERKLGLFILHNSREHNLTEVVNMALLISYYSSKDKINEFYKRCKGLSLKETYSWLVRNNTPFTRGKSTPMMLRQKDKPLKFKSAERTVVYSRGDYTHTPNGNKIDFTYEMQNYKLPIFFCSDEFVKEIYYEEFEKDAYQFHYNDNDIKIQITPWFRHSCEFKSLKVESTSTIDHIDVRKYRFFKLFLVEFCQYFLEIEYLDDEEITNEDMILISIIEGITTINIETLYFLWMSTEEWRNVYNEEESYYFSKEVFLPFDILKRSIVTYGSYGLIEQRLEGLKSFVLTFLKLEANDPTLDHYFKMTQTDQNNKCNKIIRVEGFMNHNRLTKDELIERTNSKTDSHEFLSYSRLISLLYIDGFLTRPDHTIFKYKFIGGFYKYNVFSLSVGQLKYGEKLRMVEAVNVIDDMIEEYELHHSEGVDKSDESGF